MENELLNETVEETGTPKEQKKKSKKKIIIIVIVVIAVILLALVLGSVMKNFSANMQEQMNAMMGDTESTYTVERQDVEQEITTSGNVIGIETKAYTSPVNAKVEDIRVEVGQTVKKGDILLTYDASELGDNLAKVKIQAQSERAAGNEGFEQAAEAASKTKKAKKSAKSIQSDIDKLKKEIEKLSDDLETYNEKMTEYATSVEKDQAEVESAKAAQKAAQTASTETDENGAPVASSTQALTQANSDLAAANSKLEADKAKLQEYKDLYKSTNKKLTKKNEELQELQTDLAEQEGIVSANKDVKVSESTKAQLAASNELSQMNINDAQESYDDAEAGITAEASGIVASIDVYKGAFATESQTLLTIIDGDKIGVEFSISKDDLGSITNGQKARVVVSGHEYEGTVDFVSRVATLDTAMASGSNATSGGTIKGRILLDNPDENIYIGVSAKAYIFVGKSENALTIPYEALCSDIDGDYVYVVNDENLIERKDVKIGIYSDEYYEVLEGISEGDKVIRNVTSDMKPGDTYVEGNAAMAGMPGME
ncbi:MAG: efflux RND transporter periplasmic adaptor subunit [Clostridiales bacterium]|nr:efflux RND transporter periplasmic adaptor subunit [Clostridiales bacterium]